MKRITLAAALLALTFSTSVNAQDVDQRDRLRLGLKGGLNFSSLIQDDYPNYEVNHKLGYVGGAYLSIPLTTFLGIQPEVLVSQKGFSSSNSNFFGGTYTFNRTTTYLDIPLMVQLKPSQFITIVGGIQYSYLLSKKDEITGNSVIISDQVTYDNQDITKNILGVVGGIDINIKHFMVFGRYNLDLRRNNGDGTSSVPRYKNQVFQVGVGLVF